LISITLEYPLAILNSAVLIRVLCFLAQTATDCAFSVETTYCASVRGKKVTLRMGRKGGLSEKSNRIGGNYQYDKCLLGRLWTRSVG
jgi:hypothetical protein